MLHILCTRDYRWEIKKLKPWLFTLQGTDCSECYLSVGTQQTDILLYLWFKYIFCNTKGWHEVQVYYIKTECQLCPSDWTPTSGKALTCPPCPGVRHTVHGPARPDSRYLWEPASRGWSWTAAQCVPFAQTQTHSHAGATKDFLGRLQWQTQLPRVTGVRKSLVVTGVQALKVFIFQPVLWHSRFVWGGFTPGHEETAVGRKGNLFLEEMAVEEKGL